MNDESSFGALFSGSAPFPVMDGFRAPAHALSDAVFQATVIRLFSVSTAMEYARTHEMEFVEILETLYSGECGAEGNNMLWTIDNKGVLTVSGSGNMADYAGPEDSPFNIHEQYIKSIVFEEGIGSIGDNAFNGGWKQFKQITLPDSLTRIGKYAFSGWSSLTGIVIPENVKVIDESAFRNCEKLYKLTLSDGVENIGEYAFFNCISLLDFSIPKSVTSIGKDAFRNCSSLTAITIPESLSSISDSLFYQCVSLKKVLIPDSITSIGSSAFLIAFA